MTKGNGPFAEALPLSPPPGPPIMVPVVHFGATVRDRLGAPLAYCPNEATASKLAFIINAHSGTL